MKHKTFLWFILPSGLAMLLFIALPIVSVLLQSVFAPHEQVIREVENCDVFGCKKTTTVDVEATAALSEAAPLGRFVGTDIYTDRNHLALSEIGAIWSSSKGPGDFFDQILNLPFYGALAFTLTYTALVTPFAILLGFCIALAVNAIPRLLRGPAIFFSLLPMIVTPNRMCCCVRLWSTTAPEPHIRKRQALRTIEEKRSSQTHVNHITRPVYPDAGP